MSHILFDLALEKILKEIMLDKESVKLGKNNIRVLAFVNDIDFKT